jgi:phosphatidate cytidylyltransferase
VEANLKARLGTALVGVPLLILLIGWGNQLLFAAALFVLTLAALREYFAMVFPTRRLEQLIGVVFGGGVSLALFVPGSFEVGASLGLALAICFSIYLFLAGGLEEKLVRLSWTLLGGFYLGLLLPHWVLLFRLPEGRAWVFFVLLVIMSGDSVAYFVGRGFGSRKLMAEISPGKTVEGAWGYLGGSLTAGLIGGRFLLPELPWPETAALSVCLSVLGQLGDLFESWIKRVFSKKDSGALLPGHGGLLDRLDSLIFPAVFTAIYLKVFHS